MSDLTLMAESAARELPVAELHGAVCGLAVCLGESLPLEDLIELVGVDALADQSSVETFVAASIQALQAEDMSFTPLFAEQNASLADRLEAIGQWCAAFLAGLAAGLARRGAGSLDDCPDEVREIVRDFAAIAQVDAAPAGGESEAAADERSAHESEEADLMELEEFVKVGTLLIMTSLSDEHDDDGGRTAEDGGRTAKDAGHPAD